MSRLKKAALPVSHGGGDAGNASTEPALTMPTSGIDPDWCERIDLAKRAYQEGKKLREGKPITFRMSPSLNLGDGPNV